MSSMLKVVLVNFLDLDRSQLTNIMFYVCMIISIRFGLTCEFIFTKLKPN